MFSMYVNGYAEEKERQRWIALYVVCLEIKVSSAQLKKEKKRKIDFNLTFPVDLMPFIRQR